VTRDLGRLADTTFDVLVVGAGIYGATIACDAARRGFSVALIDKGDFGGATSANSLKTVHGGLRSLQRGALAEVRLFVRERRTLLRIAPHLVAPLTFVVPTSRHPVRNTAVMRIALALNDLVARDRNQGLLPSRRLHGGRLLARDEVIRLAPELDPAGLTGGASWCDAQMLNSERLVLAFVQSAAEAGAVTCNHVAADRLLRDGPRAVGAAARDVLTGHAFDVRARVTINAAGAWAAGLSSEVTRRPEAALLPSVSRALNVVTPRAASGPAIGGLSDGRFFFKVPWRGLAMYGTSHDPFNAGPDEARPPAEAVSALLADVNRAFPGAPVSLDEVSLVHWGLLPSAPSTGAHVQLAKRSVIRDHRADGAEGLVTVIGVRYTTARQTAQDAVDLAARLLGTSTAPGRDEAVLVGGDFDEPGELHRRVKAAVAGASDTDAQRLGRNYGSRVREILRLVARTPDLTAPLSSRCPVWRAEVRLAAEAELALTLTDALVRRTEAGSAGHPGLDAARAAAEEMAQVHAWDAPRMAREIDALDAHYRLQPSPHRA
jgi:glycerol-3-phosphate dehydrogenase